MIPSGSMAAPGLATTKALTDSPHSGSRQAITATSAKPVKVPQTGRVIIQHDVEIGAATTIDRGGIRDTVIGEGSKVDNQCQIGHNVVLGRYCIVVAQCGLSGSVTLEDYAALGGSVGLAPHVTIGKGAQVAARSGVMHDIPPGEIWGGYPATPRARSTYEPGLDGARTWNWNQPSWPGPT